MSRNQLVRYLQLGNEKVPGHPTEFPSNTTDPSLQKATRARRWLFQPVRGIYTDGGLAPVPGKRGAPLHHPLAAGRRCGNSAHPGCDRRHETFLLGNWWYARLRECPLKQDQKKNNNKNAAMTTITKPLSYWCLLRNKNAKFEWSLIYHSSVISVSWALCEKIFAYIRVKGLTYQMLTRCDMSGTVINYRHVAGENPAMPLPGTCPT